MLPSIVSVKTFPSTFIFTSEIIDHSIRGEENRWSELCFCVVFGDVGAGGGGGGGRTAGGGGGGGSGNCCWWWW